MKIHELWELISRPGNLNQTHPYCLSNEVIRWDGEYHSDRLIYLNGRNYIRKFNTWNENEGYSLSIGEENGPQSFVEWRIDFLSENKSLLTITIYPHILSKFPRGRFLEIHEFTSLICWLSSEENTFSTAAVFDISGGRSTY